MKKILSQPTAPAKKRPSDSVYRPPRLRPIGPVGSLVCGASWKGVDSNGQIDPENSYPS